MQRLAGEYYHLRSVPAALRTVEQTTRLLELGRWHKTVYQNYEDLLSVTGKDATTMRDFSKRSEAYERGR